MSKLHDIYMRTDYYAYGHVLNIGKANTGFDSFLLDRDVTTWAIITWNNPNAKKIDDALNKSRNSRLKLQLSRYFDVLLAVGRGDGWSEDSFLVLGIGREEALWFATVGCQVAFIYGVSGYAPELIYAQPNLDDIAF